MKETLTGDKNLDNLHVAVLVDYTREAIDYCIEEMKNEIQLHLSDDDITYSIKQIDDVDILIGGKKLTDDYLENLERAQKALAKSKPDEIALRSYICVEFKRKQ